MSNSSTLSIVGRVVGGYLLSSMAAVTVPALVMFANRPDNIGTFILVLFAGFAYISFLGLPGFAAVALLARCCRIRHWAYFTAAGGLNAILAWMLVGGLRAPFMMFGHEVMLMSLLGGVVGGLTYWFVAEYSRPDRRDAVTAE